MADHNLDLAKHEFKEPELLTTEELAQIFEQAPMLQEWVNAVSEHLLSKAISGEKIPGYKIVEGRSIRKWTDESAVQEVLTACDYTPDQFQVVKLAGSRLSRSSSKGLRLTGWRLCHQGSRQTHSRP